MAGLQGTRLWTRSCLACSVIVGVDVLEQLYGGAPKRSCQVRVCTFRATASRPGRMLMDKKSRSRVTDRHTSANQKRFSPDMIRRAFANFGRPQVYRREARTR